MPKVRITLEGSEQVIRQLNALGVAGANAVTTIQNAAARGVGFENVGRASQVAAAGFVTAGRSAEQAAAGFAVGRRELVGLSKALKEVQLGAVAGQFAPLIGIGARLGVIGAAITAVVAAFTGGTAAAFKFAEGAAETSKALDELARSTNTSYESLSSLQQIFQQGGTPLAKFAQEFGQLSEKIQAARDALAAERAGPDAVKQANDIDNLTQKFKNLADGISQTFSPLTTFKSMSEAALKAIVSAPLGAFGLPLKQSVQQSEAEFLKLADIFKNLASDAERVQLGKALGLSPSFVATLSLGSAAIQKLQADLKALGLTLNELNKPQLSAFQQSMATAGAVWDALKAKLGEAAAPAFTSFFKGLADGLRQLGPQFQQLGAAFGKIDFEAIGRGAARAALALGEFALNFVKMLEAFGRGDTKTAEANLKKMFDTLGEVLTPVATTLGTVIGKAIVDGIINSIQIKEGSLADKILKMLQAAPTAPATPAPGSKGPGGVKSWGDLFQKMFGISPAGAGEAGGPDFGPMIQAAEVAASKIEQIFASIKVDFSSLTNGAQEAVNQISQLFSTAFQPSNFQAPQIDWSKLSNGAQEVVSTISQLFSTMVESITGVASGIGSAFSNIDIASALSQQIEQLIAKFRQLEEAARRAAAAGSGGGGGATGMPLASGGLVGGRGTGTSDSNLAWLSRGEYVTPARAVRQPGVLALLEALRRSGGNLRGVLDDMGHFARGGLVLPVPAFARGGLNTGGSSSRTLHLTIGNETFRNLSVPESTALSLERFAVHSQIASTGRKPSWRR